MEKKQEIRLVNLVKAGKHDAMRHLMERYEREIFYYIYKMTGNVEDAKDLTQEVFIKVFRKISGFNGRSAFRTWLYRIATNHTLNFLKRRPPSGSKEPLTWLSDPSPSSLERLERSDLHQHVGSAIEKLPRQQKAIVTLRAREGLTYAEIATILGCSIGNCKAAYHNAIIKLREIFKNDLIM